MIRSEEVLQFLVGTPDDSREIDRIATEMGIDPLILMENASLAVFRVLRQLYNLENINILVLAGVGNNGGDALGLARKLHVEGYNVKVVIIGDPDNYRYPAKVNYNIVKALNMDITYIRSTQDIPVFSELVEWSDVIVDGVLGVGLNRDVRGVHSEVISLVNMSGKDVISIDIPSGVGGKDGKIYGAAIRAKATVVMGILKIGNLIYPGAEYNGKLYISRLSYPSSLLKSINIRQYVNLPIFFPRRREESHKGDYGKLLTVGGAVNYYGAPLFSTYAFLKSGGGYARLASLEEVIKVVAQKAPEIVFHPLKANREGAISSENLETILELIYTHRIDILIVGPGLSRSEDTLSLVRELLKKSDKPVILDGDGLYAIKDELDIVAKRRGNTVLTPHKMEFSRIFGLDIDYIEDNRVEVLREMSSKTNSIIVFKGAHTLIGYPNGDVFINLSGNPGMATAGSGDVLNGVIAASYGMGLRLGDAVKAGVFLHGLAGDIAAKELGMDGFTAWDLIMYLPKAVKLFRENHREVINSYLPEVVL